MTQTAKQLGYTESPTYFESGRFNLLPYNELGYGCRKAAQTSGLRGVYLLRDKEGRNNVPVVFLCQAKTEDEAHLIHRRIWNLNLVPFLVVETPTRVRVYQGFSFEPKAEKDLAFLDASLDNVAEVLERVGSFRAEAIDSGTVFKQWGAKVTPKSRVDTHLLGQLELLDDTLRKMGLPRDASHCLIGKYVWLSYLSDRRILSDWRLARAGVQRNEVFGPDAKLTAFHQLDEYLQGWLNGEIFPLHGEALRAVKSEHLQKVAAIFAGEEANGQMPLFTDLYDFSHLPIETLSVVYEQFLHHKEEGDETSEGEESGAYYTPICLTDFMIEELDRKLPLRDGVAVFDPACGSGAFLVQAYRRLVERTKAERGDLKLTELRSLVKENIFGVDRDPDACRVARMSLAIALLDYADPPDVSGPNSNFQLPSLAEDNIRQKDFFELDASWPLAKDRKPPQWIIGNPPWVELKTSKRGTEKDKRNKPAWDWFNKNKEIHPTSGNQVAEAFLWRVTDFCRPETVIGLVVPAMTLFKHEAKKFRQTLFTNLNVWSVANFANLAYVLFSGRANRPAVCLFYRPGNAPKELCEERIATFAPYVAEQNANQPGRAGEQLDTWNILVRAQDWREIDRKEAQKGERLTWKLAMWGSEREQRLLNRLRKQFPSFKDWAAAQRLIFAAAPEFRKGPGKGLTFEQRLVGQKRLSFAQLRNSDAIYTISQLASEMLTKESCYVRERGGRKGFEACEPPHIILDKGWRFAVYTNEFCIPPAGQLAIHGKNPVLLKALAAYLCSPIARWFQFFVSSEWGVAVSVARRADLCLLPIPIKSASDPKVAELASAYENLQKHQDALMTQDGKSNALKRQLDNQILELLGLRTQERDLIEGFFAGPWMLIKGKFPDEAVEAASSTDLKNYCRILRRELDDYLEDRGVRHAITASLGANEVSVTIEGKRANQAIDPVIQAAVLQQSDAMRRIAASLREKHSQRVYFEKNLYLYYKGRMTFVKPRRRLEWNARQALLDADDLIAELLAGHD